MIFILFLNKLFKYFLKKLAFSVDIKRKKSLAEFQCVTFKELKKNKTKKDTTVKVV